MYSPEGFSFDRAPLNQPYHPAIAITTYLLAIHLLERNAHKNGVTAMTMEVIRYAQIVHNLLLSLASLAMVLAMIIAILRFDMGYYPKDPDAGTDYLICPRSPAPHQGLLGFLVYLFYLSKYWELLDTLLQMCKGRRPPSYYFHIWHHTCYLAICWAYCHYRASLSSLAVIVNGSVHVMMYYYYHLQARGVNIWWKHWITRVQIVQFLAGYGFFLSTMKRIYIDMQDCNGKGILLIHALFNMTMLIGFLRILRRIRRDQFKRNIKPAHAGETVLQGKIM